jgi:hypothetical protein
MKLLETKPILLLGKEIRDNGASIQKFLEDNPRVCTVFSGNQRQHNEFYKIFVNFGIFSNLDREVMKAKIGNKTKILVFEKPELISGAEVRWYKYLSSRFVHAAYLHHADRIFFIFDLENSIGQDIIESKFVNPVVRIYDMV